MKFNQVLNNFTSGEWSPKMRGRTDVQQYPNACEALVNFFTQIHGGAFRRPPTNRIALDSDSDIDLQTAFSNTEILCKLIPQVTANGSKNLFLATSGFLRCDSGRDVR